MRVVCTYGVNGLRVGFKTARVLHRRWEGDDTDFFTLYASLEDHRKLDMLVYALAINVDTKDTLYEVGSKEDVEHAATLLDLTS